MKIFDYLEDLYEYIKDNEWDDVENRYRKVAVKLAGKDIIADIDDVNLDGYEEDLEAVLSETVEKCEDEGYTALYFEYDMDEDWESSFSCYSRYTAEGEDEEEEWMENLEDKSEGPTLPDFGEIYKKYCAGDDARSAGVMLYLIVKTVCALGRRLENIQTSSLAVCIGYSNQLPIWRIREIETS